MHNVTHLNCTECAQIRNTLCKKLPLDLFRHNRLHSPSNARLSFHLFLHLLDFSAWTVISLIRLLVLRMMDKAAGHKEKHTGIERNTSRKNMFVYEWILWLTSRSITLISRSSFIWARRLLTHQKCTTHTRMSQTRRSGDSWVTGDVVCRSSFISHIWWDPRPCFSTSFMLYLFSDDRLPYGERLARNTDALLEYFFSLLSLPPSVSFFRCAIISLPLQTNLSLSTLQTGDACALMMLI